jgi:hypothetical protein
MKVGRNNWRQIEKMNLKAVVFIWPKGAAIKKNTYSQMYPKRGSLKYFQVI